MSDLERFSHSLLFLMLLCTVASILLVTLSVCVLVLAVQQ